jgi:altronate hydrolase
MDSPGFDPCSVTGQVASGCNIIAFTTGRGSAFGCKPSPSIKIATNQALYDHMPEDMDINAGAIVTGGETIESVGKAIFTEVLDVASGKKTRSEAQGLGELEFVPWQIGAVM